jgi:hypothetical protein
MKGARVGVTLFDTELAADTAPYDVVAVTAKAYATPVVKPLTVIGLVVLVPVRPPGEE